jgi:hypothetical protein
MLCLLAPFAAAQSKSKDTILQQIRNTRSDKAITLYADPSGGNSKLMAVSENFDDDQTGSAGVRAMNFAAGFFFAGQELTRSPDPIMFTFWAMTKKPRFAENHHLTVFLPAETLDLGDARYAAKARTDMEYLNFELSRETLTKIARESNVRLRLGDHDFNFTRAQLKLLADLLIISDVSKLNQPSGRLSQ